MREVIKRDGSREEFRPEKVIESCRRIGLGKRKCEEALSYLLEAVSFPVSSREIHEKLMSIVREFGTEYPLIMGMRKAIAELGPVAFEKFVAELLSRNGFRTEWNRIIEGYAVEHQVDVIAKGRKTWLVECKRHVNPHRDTGLNVVLQNKARLDDILDGLPEKGYPFDGAWVVTNTKFSHHAKQYAKVRGIRLTGWRYEDEWSMERMAESTGAIPITILQLPYRERRHLISRGILTLADFLEKKPHIKQSSELLEIARKIIRRLRRKWQAG